MQFIKRVLVSTRLTKDNIKFTKEALEKLIEQINTQENPMPLNISHDNTRPVGIIIKGSAKLIDLEDGEYAAIATGGIFESKEEFEEAGFGKSQLIAIEDKLEDINENVWKMEKDVNNPTYVLRDKFTVEAFDFELNEESMFLVDNFSKITQKGIKINDDYVAVYDNFFRRYYKFPNTFCLRLFNYTKKLLEDKKDIKFTVKLDPRKISKIAEYSEYIEQDYAWGPKLPKKLEELEEGVTKYTSSERVSEYEKILDVDFWWHKKNENLMTLEIEERISPEFIYSDELNGKGIPLRYCHLEYDIKNNKIIHLDFAIRFYEEDSYVNERFLGDISKCGKKSKRIKLFRMDGDLEREEAFNLISLYYHNNEDVKEYLSGE